MVRVYLNMAVLSRFNICLEGLIGELIGHPYFINILLLRILLISILDSRTYNCELVNQ